MDCRISTETLRMQRIQRGIFHRSHRLHRWFGHGGAGVVIPILSGARVCAPMPHRSALRDFISTPPSMGAGKKIAPQPVRGYLSIQLSARLGLPAFAEGLAAAAAATAAAAALFTRASFVHGEGTALHVFAVEGFDSRFGFS